MGVALAHTLPNKVSIHVKMQALQSYLNNEPCVFQRTLKIVGHISNHAAPFRAIGFSCRAKLVNGLKTCFELMGLSVNEVNVVSTA